MAIIILMMNIQKYLGTLFIGGGRGNLLKKISSSPHIVFFVIVLLRFDVSPKTSGSSESKLEVVSALRIFMVAFSKPSAI